MGKALFVHSGLDLEFRQASRAVHDPNGHDDGFVIRDFVTNSIVTGAEPVQSPRIPLNVEARFGDMLQQSVACGATADLPVFPFECLDRGTLLEVPVSVTRHILETVIGREAPGAGQQPQTLQQSQSSPAEHVSHRV